MSFKFEAGVYVVFLIKLEWTTSLYTSCRTLFVCVSGCRSTSRSTSSYVITSDYY